MTVRTANVAPILGATLLYRVATSMGPLAILIAVTQKQSLASASFSLTCWTLAGAITQPFWISVAERAGHRVTLLCLGLLTSMCHLAIGVLPGSAWTMILAGLAGATLPPITAQARALFARILDGDELMSAFDSESALASSAFVIAPLVVAAASVFGPVGPLASCAFLLAVVSLAYAQMGCPPADTIPPHRAQSPEVPDDSMPVLLWPALVLVASGSAAYAMLACIEVVAVARLSSPAATALVLSAWAAVSLATGMLLSRSRRLEWLRGLLLPVPAAACLIMALFSASHIQVFVAVLIVSGVAVAPTLALITSEVARVTPYSYQPRIYGWLQAGSWLGSAAATAVAGVLATGSLHSLLLLATAFATTSVVLLCVSRLYGPTAAVGTETSQHTSDDTG